MFTNIHSILFEFWNLWLFRLTQDNFIFIIINTMAILIWNLNKTKKTRDYRSVEVQFLIGWCTNERWCRYAEKHSIALRSFADEFIAATCFVGEKFADLTSNRISCVMRKNYLQNISYEKLSWARWQKLPYIYYLYWYCFPQSRNIGINGNKLAFTKAYEMTTHGKYFCVCASWERI